MANRHFFTAIVSVMFALGMSLGAQADNQWVDLGAAPQQGVQISVLEAEPTRTVVELRLGGYWLDAVEIEGM